MSSGKDGSFKVWDLTSSRLMHSFALPKSVHVTSFQFNPEEFLLAAATTERLVGLWRGTCACVVLEPSSVLIYQSAHVCDFGLGRL